MVTARSEWMAIAGLLLLSVVPVLAGMLRMVELAGGVETTPDSVRYFASPVPVMLHVVSVTLYCVVGAFQFSSQIRNRHVSWHRMSGRLLVPMGLAAALSGLWMTHFYPPLPNDSQTLYFIRWAVGGGMVAAILLGLHSILGRNVAGHRAWMIRAYALGMGAGTQVFTHLPWMMLGGEVDETARTFAIGAGWVINIAIAEWIIRKQPRRWRPRVRLI